MYNLKQPMNLSFYQTVVKSLSKKNESNLNDISTSYGAPTFLENESSIELPTDLNNLVTSNRYVSKPLNLNNYLNTMFTTLYSQDTINNPRSDEVLAAIDSIKGLSDQSKH